MLWRASSCPPRSKSASRLIRSLIANLSISPLDEDGNPVDPMFLPEYVKTHRWDRPFCFCAIRGSPHRVKFTILKQTGSKSPGKMCFACSKSRCPYFGESIRHIYMLTSLNDFNIVNVSDLLDHHREDVLSVPTNKDSVNSSDSGQYTFAYSGWAYH